MKKHQLISIANGVLLSLVMSGCANTPAPSPSIALYAQHGAVSFQDSSLHIDSIGLCNEKTTPVFEAKTITMTNDVPIKAFFTNNAVNVEYGHFEDGTHSSVNLCFEDKERRILKVIKKDEVYITEPDSVHSYYTGEGPLDIQCSETTTGMNKSIACR